MWSFLAGTGAVKTGVSGSGSNLIDPAGYGILLTTNINIKKNLNNFTL